MSILTSFLTSVGLSGDSFAASVASSKKVSSLQKILISFVFASSHFIMPIIGFYSGFLFIDFVSSFDHWMAFLILVFLGVKSIKESFEKEEEIAKISLKSVFLVALATSLDALAVGLGYAFSDGNIWELATMAFVIIFLVCLGGFWVGEKLGNKLEGKIEILSGLILIAIGTKILIEHLWF